MGVDISGRNPIHRTPKHDYPNWNELSDKERDDWFEMDEKWHKENPGDYFRSNWWGWRPIVQLCETVDNIYGLNIDFNGWGSNDGKGLETQKECNKLAEGLEKFTSKIDWVDDEDWMGIFTECWSTLDGGFVENTKEVRNLNSEYEWGDVIRQSIVLPSGMVVEPAHKVYKCRIDTFINFLKECGGFSIW
jgi:hypothetical protein